MARRFRRRRRVNWFPVQATPQLEDTAFPGHLFSFPAEPDELSFIVFPLTFDEPREFADLAAGTATLADNISSGYMLNRVVGKVVIGYEQRPNNQLYSPSAYVAAGLFVARASNDGTEPVGLDNVGTGYNPADPGQMQEPWLWRRTWWLSNQIGPDPNGIRPWYSGFPTANTQAASSLDGAHIDAKTRRKIVGDDRLWFAMGALGYPQTNDPNALSGVIGVHFDYRLLGSIISRPRKTGSF